MLRGIETESGSAFCFLIVVANLTYVSLHHPSCTTAPHFSSICLRHACAPHLCATIMCAPIRLHQFVCTNAFAPSSLHPRRTQCPLERPWSHSDLARVANIPLQRLSRTSSHICTRVQCKCVDRLRAHALEPCKHIVRICI